MSRIFVTTIEDSPGRVHIAMFEGHGADQVAMRKELSEFEMRDMHEKLTAALYDRLSKADEALREAMQGLAADIISGARRP